ncbi:DUF6193 family natural product biosynthesis protein [Streptomyces exfoliatus]|uniref:DUF6193 family natural product biosynthesis protein n=1 Tax=Streptomyces exfoliatus TaxID=1905 RepID=UPI003CCBC564
MSSDERASAHERGPAAVVDLQWRLLREQAAGKPEFPEFGLLVEAAYAESRLRRLSAFSSHRTQGFSASTGHSSKAEVAIVPAHGGRPYRVQEFLHDGGVIGEAETADEAVALATTHLPVELGPGVAGPDDAPMTGAGTSTADSVAASRPRRATRNPTGREPAGQALAETPCRIRHDGGASLQIP